MKVMHCILSVTAILAMSLVASADVNKTWIGDLDSAKTTTLRIPLPAGKNLIEVFNPYEETPLTCKFTDVSTGLTGLTQENVTRCEGRTKSTRDLQLDVSIQNLSNKSISFRVTRSDEK